MAGNVSGLHLFGPDTGPEALSLLDGNYGALTTALNTLANFTNNYIDSGAVNALIVNVPAPQVFSYSDGIVLSVKVAATSTIAAPTINVNGLGLKTIVNPSGSALDIGQLVAGGWVMLEYESTSGKFMVIAGGVPVHTFTSGGNTIPSLIVGGSANYGILTVGLGSANANATAGDPPHILEAINSDGSMQGVRISSYGTGPVGSTLHFIHMRGTISAPAALVAGDNFLSIGARGYDTAPTGSSIAIEGTAGENWSNGHNGSQLDFQLTPNGQPVTSRASVMILASAIVKVTPNLANYGASGNPDVTTTSVVMQGGSSAQLFQINSTNAANSRMWSQYVDGAASIHFRQVNDLNSGGSDYLSAARSGTGTIASIAIGNATDLPTLALFASGIQGHGPVAAAQVDMTPDKSSFTGTLTGFTANPTGTVNWVRMGNFAALRIGADISATPSNATTMTMTGLPAAVQPTGTVEVNCTSILNNGTGQLLGVASINGGTITFSLIAGSPAAVTAFTAAGLKGLQNGWCVVYPIA
jgi:hypothetical protein